MTADELIVLFAVYSEFYPITKTTNPFRCVCVSVYMCMGEGEDNVGELQFKNSNGGRKGKERSRGQVR